MDDYEMDEATGLGGLPSEAEGEETANITDAADEQGALPFGVSEIQSKYGELLKRYETSNQNVLNQIAAARKRVLSRPTEKSKEEYLRGLALALTTPPERTDPRFYERKNLFTFLRDVGAYGAAEDKAAKEAKLKREEELAKIDELKARYETESTLGLLKELEPSFRASMRPVKISATEYSPSEGRQYVFTDPEAAGVASARAPQVFRKDLGYGYIDDQGKFRPQREAPTGTRVVTSGALNPQSIKTFDDRQVQFTEEMIGLEKLQDYFKNVSSLDRGFKTLANKFTANLKNFLGKKIDGKEFATLTADAKKEALLGALRTEVLGPGVLTEIDAQRLIRTLGGDVNQWFNPDLVASRLADIYKEKHQRAKVISSILKRDASVLGYDPQEFEIKVPSVLGGDVLRERKPKDSKPPSSSVTKPPPAGSPTTAPAATKVIRGKTWVLKKDAKGNMAYVSPDGKEFEEVR